MNTWSATETERGLAKFEESNKTVETEGRGIFPDAGEREEETHGFGRK